MYRSAAEGAGAWHMGAAVDEAMLDLRAASVACAREHTSDARDPLPESVMELLRRGESAMDKVRRVHAWAVARRDSGAGGALFRPLRECVLDAPLRPGKLITLARNYREHVAEHGLTHTGKVPSASIKASSSLTGPYDDIVRPAVERKLDYETELAVVIGRRCKNVPQADAYSVIAGYLVLSDIVAREVLKIERDAGNQFLGKMFDSFGPLGPVIESEVERVGLLRNRVVDDTAADVSWNWTA